MAATLVAVWAGPAWSWACPVCGADTSAQSRSAYRWSVLWLSALPLVMIGGLVVFAWRRSRRVAVAGPAAAAPPPAQPHAVHPERA